MSNIIPFESTKLPSYLKTVDRSALNTDLSAHASAGFPVLSIKGKVFTEVRDGEKVVLPNPKDPDSPATSLDLVIIKGNPTKSKVFYANGFDEKAESKKPDCFSNDGSKPDASVDKPMSSTCATCPKNEWGSKISETGKKLKACSDSVKLAVAKFDDLEDPYLLRVPAASMTPLGDYNKLLNKRGVDHQMVLTKIGFDMTEASPKLTYKPEGFLDEAQWNKVKEVAQSDVVRRILGASVTEVHEAEAASVPAEQVAEKKTEAVITKAKTVTKAEVAAAVEAPKVVKEEPKVEPINKVAPVVDAGDDDELDLSGLSFDD